MQSNSTPYRLVMTTIGSLPEAENLATRLTNEGLAACVNVLPQMQSYYIWKGQAEQGTEHQLLIKTRQERLDAVIEVLADNHPYELPEIIVVPIEGGFAPYLNWLTESVTSHDKN